MFNHLLQIASFKSSPGHFKAPIWGIVVCTILFTAAHGFSLSFTPGNEPIRMYVASLIKIVAFGALLYVWMRSVECSEHFLSTLMVFIFVSLLAEVVKMPLTQIVRDLKDTGDALTALLISIPIGAIMIWNIGVLYYCLKQIAQRGTVEIVVVVIVVVLISEVAGGVLSQIGAPIDMTG